MDWNHFANRGFLGDYLYSNKTNWNHWYDNLDTLFGYRSYKDTLAKNQLQIDYNQYMANANTRKLADWNKNVGSQGRKIAYPELSMAGAIFGYNTGVGSAYLSNDIAYSNYAGSHLYRGMGLYGIAGRVSRSL